MYGAETHGERIGVKDALFWEGDNPILSAGEFCQHTLDWSCLASVFEEQKQNRGTEASVTLLLLQIALDGLNDCTEWNVLVTIHKQYMSTIPGLQYLQ